ncbi:hypothetical protein C5167_041132 [Papaver somniferum]|uniref:Glycolipid transfer protein domain-containing protein n=1 Tax=Papaver somniferum TaxID=3469 RepID=A0A4Y7IH01_PAPSO|nr:uncharacterized protein LOC113339748 [Papaver somniferum]RZC48187.1 hypothetical protein C5167_041132 [Papaver somniferum]
MPTLLKTMSVAFRKLETTVNQGREIEVKPFIEACSTINSLTSHLHSGPISVVGDLNEEVSAIKNASTTYSTLNSMLEAGIERDNVLNLRRVIEVVENLFQDILDTDFDDEDDNSLVDQGYRAYSMVFGQHLGDSFRTNIAKFVHLIPSKGVPQRITGK